MGFKTINKKLGLIVVVGFTVLIFFVMWMNGWFSCSKCIARDMRRINEIEYLQSNLDLYFWENNSYPTSLLELRNLAKKDIPKDPKTKKDYLYAYYPSENPTAYHLGAVLELKKATILKNDSDFNSESAGYVNGFDGKDPVYDLHVSK